MAAQKEFTAPEWVFPGAKVVRVTENRSNVVAVVDTIKSVGKAWITLENEVVRIGIRNLRSAHQGSSYDGRVIRIVEGGTEEAQRLLADTRVLRATVLVQRCAKAWESNPRGEAERSNLRAALDRLDNAIEKASE